MSNKKTKRKKQKNYIDRWPVRIADKEIDNQVNIQEYVKIQSNDKKINKNEMMFLAVLTGECVKTQRLEIVNFQPTAIKLQQHETYDVTSLIHFLFQCWILKSLWEKTILLNTLMILFNWSPCFFVWAISLWTLEGKSLQENGAVQNFSRKSSLKYFHSIFCFYKFSFDIVMVMSWNIVALSLAFSFFKSNSSA